MFYVYRLRNEKGEAKELCKKFFNGTLGYCETSSIVAIAKSNPTALQAAPDQREKKRQADNLVNDMINTHILSYNPCISHYRREHAPKRLYLPHGLSVKDMHQDYLEKNAKCLMSHTLDMLLL